MQSQYYNRLSKLQAAANFIFLMHASAALCIFADVQCYQCVYCNSNDLARFLVWMERLFPDKSRTVLLFAGAFR
jgi:hypothetical protein